MGYIILILEVLFVIIGLVLLCSSRHYKTDAVYSILLTKNSEDYIEGIVRDLKKSFRNKINNPASHKLLVFDLGSTDSTSSILEILAKDCSFIEIVYFK